MLNCFSNDNCADPRRQFLASPCMAAHSPFWIPIQTGDALPMAMVLVMTMSMLMVIKNFSCKFDFPWHLRMGAPARDTSFQVSFIINIWSFLVVNFSLTINAIELLFFWLIIIWSMMINYSSKYFKFPNNFFGSDLGCWKTCLYVLGLFNCSFSLVLSL